MVVLPIFKHKRESCCSFGGYSPLLRGMGQRHPQDTHMGFQWGARRRSSHCWTASKVKSALKGRFVMFFTLLCWLDGSMEHLFPATELLMENTLVMAKTLFSLHKASPWTAQGWIAGLTAQGILPVITGNRFRHVAQLCPKICDSNRMIYAVNESNGSQDLSSYVSICFLNWLFFSFTFGELEFGFCFGSELFPTRVAASSWLDCTRQEGGGMSVGSSDSTCLVQLIGFHLWAVGRWWLQHIKALGNNT